MAAPYLCPFNLIFGGGAIIATYHSLAAITSEKLPDTVQRLYSYGKTAIHTQHQEIGNHNKGNSVLVKILTHQLPKKYMTYYYDAALVEVLFLLLSSILAPYSPIPFTTKAISVVFWRSEHSMSVNSTLTYWICLLMMLGQVVRRWYECHYVSVSSSKSKTTVLVVIGGLIYYPSVLLALANLRMNPNVSQGGPNAIQLVGLVLFMFGFLLAHHSMIILANLRRKGPSSSDDHKIPFGGGFNYVTNPHYWGEVDVYHGLYFASNLDHSLGCVFLFVTAIQVILAVQNHNWYKKTFKDYPKDRKIIFPFF